MYGAKVITSYRTVLAIVLSMVLWVTGCSKQLLGSLDEMAANQVVGALRLEGVSADKAATGEKGWKVTVPDDAFADAVQILERRNLPSQQFQGLGQVFKKESLVSTPTEERARLMYALSQELEHSLMEIDGVLSARVHPVILAQDPLGPKRSTATASVLIKYRVGTDVNSREGMVRALVSAAIEGLSYDDVRVVMVPAETRPLGLERPATLSIDSNSPVLDRMAWHRQSPVLYAGLGFMLVALSMGYAGLRSRRRGAASLGGRWEHTLNSLFSEREARPGQARRSTGSP